MKKKLLWIIGVILLLIVSLIGLYAYSMKSISKTSEEVVFTIELGTGKQQIIDDLYEAGIIRNKYASYAHIFLNNDLQFMAGTYELDRNQSTPEILSYISDSSASSYEDTIKITFVEGKRVTDYAVVISENFDFTYDEVMAVFSDRTYAQTLIDEYDILTSEILASDIFYPLEGYLYPETYDFFKDASIDDIIRKLLNQTTSKLSDLTSKVNDGEYTLHELLSIAAIIEMEAVSSEDRKIVSQVIYSRLIYPMSLGMDVTTYYAVQKAMTEELTVTDLATDNGYNTRPTSNLGLPVGPICNPSYMSVEAALNPTSTNYLYFYADIVTGEVHFFEEYSDFVVFKNNY